MQETTALNWKSAGFREVSDKILSVINSPDSIQQISRLLSDYVSNFPLDNVSSSFINIISYFINKDIVALFGEYEQLQKMINADDVGLIPGLYNLIWLDVQMSLPRAQNPVSRKCYKNYRANISALKKSNPELAEKVRKSTLPDNYVVVDFWGGLHIFDKESSKVLDVPSNMNNAFDGMANDIRPVALTSIFSGQEIIKCLENRFNGIHGMARAHYLIEEDLSKVRTLLDIYDFSRYIENEELLLFVGEDCKEQFEDRLETCLYPFPVLTMGDDELVAELCGKVKAKVDPAGLKEQVFDYYKSDEFEVRLRKIAKGEILPRILISTCRWTTFLKYCAADFDRSFASLGCETRYIIEASDTQRLTPEIHNKLILDFKPDMVFMISHARPSMSYLPFELPVVCYLQDRCGPMLEHDDLSDHVSSRDMFVCQARHFFPFLRGKNINDEQFFVMPVPVDHEEIRPLESIPIDAEKYKSDICFVKHVLGPIDEVWSNFKKQWLDIEVIKYEETKAVLRKEIDNLFRLSFATGADHITEEYVKDFFYRLFTVCSVSSPNIEMAAQNAATSFIVTLATTTWRHQFIERLAREDFDLALFGGNWDKTEPHVAKYARGPLTGKEELRKAYGMSKINLHINNVATMHQRLIECAFAKSFVIVAGIPEEIDWEPASYYFTPEKELILAENPEHMVELCRYYLERDDLRAEIAQNMYDKAIESFTLAKGSKMVLDNFRNRLLKVLEN